MIRNPKPTSKLPSGEEGRKKQKTGKERRLLGQVYERARPSDYRERGRPGRLAGVKRRTKSGRT